MGPGQDQTLSPCIWSEQSKHFLYLAKALLVSGYPQRLLYFGASFLEIIWDIQ